MKNYSGPLVGNTTDERWTPYIKNKKRNKKSPDQFVPNWALYDHSRKIWKPINPIKQNDVHINTLNFLQKEDYKNIVLLSDSMFIDTTSTTRMIPNVMSVNEFLKVLQSSPKIYELEDLNNSYLKIKSFDKQASPEAKKLHIARIKSKGSY